MNKAKGHIRYRTKDNKIVPGVTTILGVMAKPALKFWANKIGLQGFAINKYVDILADAGTLAHNMVECHVKGIQCNTDEYSKDNIDMAENAFLKFLEWEKKHQYMLVCSEQAYVSEKYGFGGTIDLLYVGEAGRIILVDLKTSKAIYNEMETQVVAYGMLIEEVTKAKVHEHHILRIGRTEEEGFEYKKIDKIEKHKERFLTCLNLYRLNKELRKWKK